MNREFDSDDLSEQLLDLAVKDYFDMMGKSWGIRNPSDVLRECIKSKEWFKGVVLSVTFLEGIGAKVLSLHFPHQIHAEKMRLSVSVIMILLYASKIIDQSTYYKMVKVNKYRNNVVHGKKPFTELKLREKDSKTIIQMAIKCLNKLMYEFHEEGKEFFLKQNKK